MQRLKEVRGKPPNISNDAIRSRRIDFGGALVNADQKSQAQKYAVFALASYYKNPQDVRKILDKYGKQNWDVVQKTTPDATTFKNKETGKVIVAVRGTDITNISDLAHDIAIVTGVSRFTPRIKSVTEVVQYAIDTYGKENVTLTAHSAAGEYVRQMANKFNLPAYVFNRAASLLDYFNVKNKNVKDFSTNLGRSKDPVSFLGTKQQKHDHAEFEQLRDKDAHTLENFLPQNQEEIDQTGSGINYLLKHRPVFFV